MSLLCDVSFKFLLIFEFFLIIININLEGTKLGDKRGVEMSS